MKNKDNPSGSSPGALRCQKPVKVRGPAALRRAGLLSADSMPSVATRMCGKSRPCKMPARFCDENGRRLCPNHGRDLYAEERFPLSEAVARRDAYLARFGATPTVPAPEGSGDGH